jgi:GNAT superfamily N-acetyltransferase
LASVRFSDLTLARQLEAAEAASNRAFVETRAQLDSSRGACWISVAGAIALFDGVDSPLTQTFGLGLFEPLDAGALETLERFYSERSAPVFHEVSPLADPIVLELLPRRRYVPVELTSVMFRSIDQESVRIPAGAVRARPIRPGEEDVWSDVASGGWREYPELAPFVSEAAFVMARRPDGCLFLTEIDGQPIAAGALALFEKVALLAGASTLPQARGRGAQNALLAERLAYAAERGCELAMMCARPGSASQRNAERHGFRIAYTRIKWQRSLSEN